MTNSIMQTMKHLLFQSIWDNELIQLFVHVTVSFDFEKHASLMVSLFQCLRSFRTVQGSLARSRLSGHMCR